MEKSQLRHQITQRIRNGCNIKLLGDSLTAGSGSSAQPIGVSVSRSHRFRQTDPASRR